MTKTQARMDHIRDLIHETAKKKKEHPRSYLGCSELGHPCERYLWYSFRHFPRNEPFPGRVRMIFEMGNVVEDIVIGRMRDAGFEIWGQQNGYEMVDGWCQGHCDGICSHEMLGNRPHLLEIKSASNSKWLKFCDSGIKLEPKYAAQVQLYMGFEKLERCVFLVYNKDNSDIYTEIVHFQPRTFSALQEKAKRIIVANSIPDKSNRKEDCKWCDYSIICGDGEPMATEGNCGSCVYHRWHGLRKACHHPEHNYWLDRYDDGCPSYVYMWEKMLPYAAPVDDVVEYEEGQE